MDAKKKNKNQTNSLLSVDSMFVIFFVMHKFASGASVVI